MNFVLIFVSMLSPSVPAYGWYYESLSACHASMQVERNKRENAILADMPRGCMPIITGVPIEIIEKPEEPPQGEVVD